MDMHNLLVKYAAYKPTLILMMAVVGWPLISAILNLMLRKKTPEEWEKWAMSKPGLALLTELTRALGLDPKKALVAFQRYAQRKSGEIPEGRVSAPGIPAEIVAMLNDPEKRKAIVEAATKLAQAGATTEKPADPAPEKPADSAPEKPADPPAP
jgi:hypothetical protein